MNRQEDPAALATLTTFDKRYKQITLARDIARSGYSRYINWKANREAENKYFITIEENDSLFDSVHVWLTNATPDENLRNLVASTRYNYRDDMPPTLEVVHETEQANTYVFDGHPVTVELTTKKPSSKKRETLTAQIERELLGNDHAGAPTDQPQEYRIDLSKKIVFATASSEGRDAVIRFLETQVETFDKREPRFNTLSVSGWRSHTRVVNRPLDSVVLQGDQKDEIVADLTRFIGDEERYISLGLPWHRGYLFHGPPGTGKTSLATALASHFKLDVYFVALSTVESDNKLLDALTGIDTQRSKSLVVLEDIDVVHAAKTRDDDRRGVTLAGLLNALDGIATPHGMITVLTTNDVSVLDPALIRPGRVDKQLHISYVDDEQITRLCERFLGKSLTLPHITSDITPAEIVGIFKDDDPETAERNLRRLIAVKNGEIFREKFA